MRVLLKEGAELATVETILVVDPDLRETMLETLAGEAVRPGGFVAEVHPWTVGDAIYDAVYEGRPFGHAVDRTIEEVAWMAGRLAPYEAGSEIVQHLTRGGCVLEFSNAKRLGGRACILHERLRAEEADEREDYGSVESKLGRRGYARDHAAHCLEALRKRPDAKPEDIRRWRAEIEDYDRRIAELRSHLIANPIS
jgi:hypothetical protein